MKRLTDASTLPLIQIQGLALLGFDHVFTGARVFAHRCPTCGHECVAKQDARDDMMGLDFLGV